MSDTHREALRLACHVCRWAMKTDDFILSLSLSLSLARARSLLSLSLSLSRTLSPLSSFPPFLARRWPASDTGPKRDSRGSNPCGARHRAWPAWAAARLQTWRRNLTPGTGCAVRRRRPCKQVSQQGLASQRWSGSRAVNRTHQGGATISMTFRPLCTRSFVWPVPCRRAGSKTCFRLPAGLGGTARGRVLRVRGRGRDGAVMGQTCEAAAGSKMAEGAALMTDVGVCLRQPRRLDLPAPWFLLARRRLRRLCGEPRQFVLVRRALLLYRCHLLRLYLVSAVSSRPLVSHRLSPSLSRSAESKAARRARAARSSSRDNASPGPGARQVCDCVCVRERESVCVRESESESGSESERPCYETMHITCLRGSDSISSCMCQMWSFRKSILSVCLSVFPSLSRALSV